MKSTRNCILGTLGTFPAYKLPKNEDVHEKSVSKCPKQGWIPSQDSILYKAHLDDCQFEVHTLKRSDSRVMKKTSQIKSPKHPVPVTSNLIETSIPSLIVETIMSGSEQTEDPLAIPIDLPAPKPVSAQLPSANESNPNGSISGGKRGTCYVCNNKNGNGIRMFSFPSNPKMLSLWASACNLDLNRVFPGDSICSLHFKPEDIMDRSSDGKRKRCMLKRTAVPISVNEIMIAHHHDYIHSSKDTTNEFIEDIPCDIEFEEAPKTKSIGSQTESTGQQTKSTGSQTNTHYGYRRYVGEFKISDMDNPAAAKLFYEMAMQEITKNRRTVRQLQKKIGRCTVVHEELRLLKQKLRHEGKFKKKSDSDYEIITVTS